MGRQIEMPEFKHSPRSPRVKYPWDEMEVGDYFVTPDRSAKQMKSLIWSRRKLNLDKRQYTVEKLVAHTRVTRIA